MAQWRLGHAGGSSVHLLEAYKPLVEPAAASVLAAAVSSMMAPGVMGCAPVRGHHLGTVELTDCCTLQVRVGAVEPWLPSCRVLPSRTAELPSGCRVLPSCRQLPRCRVCRVCRVLLACEDVCPLPSCRAAELPSVAESAEWLPCGDEWVPRLLGAVGWLPSGFLALALVGKCFWQVAGWLQDIR